MSSRSSCMWTRSQHMPLHSTVLEDCSALNVLIFVQSNLFACANGCLLTLRRLCCVQFKSPPDYSELHLSPAQFEQYKLHADADRTAKIHSAVSHGLLAQQPCSAKSAETRQESLLASTCTEGLSWHATAVCAHLCAAACNALIRLQACVCATAEAAVLAVLCAPGQRRAALRRG